jgi:hypothetical protein
MKGKQMEWFLILKVNLCTVHQLDLRLEDSCGSSSFSFGYSILFFYIFLYYFILFSELCGYSVPHLKKTRVIHRPIEDKNIQGKQADKAQASYGDNCNKKTATCTAQALFQRKVV